VKLSDEPIDWRITLNQSFESLDLSFEWLSVSFLLELKIVQFFSRWMLKLELDEMVILVDLDCEHLNTDWSYVGRVR